MVIMVTGARLVSSHFCLTLPPVEHWFIRILRESFVSSRSSLLIQFVLATAITIPALAVAEAVPSDRTLAENELPIQVRNALDYRSVPADSLSVYV